MDLGACAAGVLRALGGPGGRSHLGVVLRGFATRAERVIAFLAVLEMCRLGWIGILQASHLGEVELTAHVAKDHPLDQLVGAVRLELEEALA